MSNRESDEDYDFIIAYLGPKHRIIEDIDDLQWIVQTKSGVWRNWKFCTYGEGVRRWIKDLPGASEVATLPTRYVTRATRARQAQGSPQPA